MAARRKSARVESTTRRARAKPKPTPAKLVEDVQQAWRAGKGAIEKAQHEGPKALQDAVAEGAKLLTRSRSNAEQMIRDAFETAQDQVQSRFGTVREQASETWDNLEALFQSRVHKALQQLGVPSGEEIRLLTQRVAELNENVKALSARQVRGRAARPKRKTRSA